jgi:hypothetical protein
MAAPRDLSVLSAEEVRKVPGFGRVSKQTANFPKRSISAADLRARQRNFLESVAPPTVTQPSPKRVPARPVTNTQLAKLRAVHRSTAATAEILAQDLDADQTLGLVYSAVATLEYTKMKSEREKRLKRGENPKRVQAQWEKVIQGAQRAFDAGGVKGVSERRLDTMARELSRSRANLNTVVDIYNSAIDVVTEGGPKLAFGNYVTVVDRIVDVLDPVVTPTTPTLCEQPVQGRYTKHLGASFSLSVRLTVPCPTWTNPFRTCTKTFTIAGVSFSVGLDVSYRITCCGATASGVAYAQACGTIVGITVCAACSATVNAVAGIGRSGSGSSCMYGLGVTAELKCTLAGTTVYRAFIPYGWSISGPCPPASLPC